MEFRGEGLHEEGRKGKERMKRRKGREKERGRRMWSWRFAWEERIEKMIKMKKRQEEKIQIKKGKKKRNMFS